MTIARIFYFITTLCLFSAPSFAVEGDDVNSGFGAELFTGAAPAALSDSDAAAVSAIEPAAGGDASAYQDVTGDTMGVVETPAAELPKPEGVAPATTTLPE